ncbi:MLO-like protein 12 [Linum perenne]
MGVEEGEIAVEATPTWAVATVCFFLLLISIAFEHLIHLISKNFTKRRSKALLRALDKIKSEMMLLGFVSLLLAVCQKLIANICIPRSIGETFLPCGFHSSDHVEEEAKCAEQGKVSLLSRQGVTQLNYLMFVLASFHAMSCTLIFSLGMAKMRRWASWEAQTRTLEYRTSKDPRMHQLAHQTSFGRRHLSFWSVHPLLRWLTCFARQFVVSVTKVDYLTLRHGFIMAHFEQEIGYNFQKFIKRAMERDFRVIVGTSIWISSFSVISIFFQAHKFQSFLWLPFVPLVMLLVIGAKLQDIITSMSMDSNGKSQVVNGTLLVRPSDGFFWFGSPKFILHLIHFIIFQNSFQLAFFTWTSKKFGLRSCFHREIDDILIRLLVGILVHFLAGYVTLPLYALVTQMGTSMRKSVFPPAVVVGLRRWRRRARKNLKKKKSKCSAEGDLGGETESSIRSSVVSLDTSPSFDSSGSDGERESESESEPEVVVIEVRSEEEERRGKIEEVVKEDSELNDVVEAEQHV